MSAQEERIPAEMRAIEIGEPGPPESLRLATAQVPEPGAGDLLIRVHAAGVNRPDVAQRQGLYPPPPGASPLPGLEVAGVVASCGDGVDAFSVGDRVCSLTNGGGYAEYVAAPAGQTLPVPSALSDVEAAALPETFFTVWTNVFERGRLQPGESLLVHGGSSGIGTTAIQMAKALGSRVFVTAGSAEKCRACEALGADVAVNYREQDFVEVLKEATDGHGVDVILDMVGGDYVQRNVQVAALEGRIVLIATLGGPRAEVDFRRVYMNRLTITGSTLRPQSAESKARIASALRERVWPLIEAGEIRPVIHEVFPLAQAADAHALMESSAHIGKIMLQVAESG